MLTPEKIWHEHPVHLTCSGYFRLFVLPQKKTNQPLNKGKDLGKSPKVIFSTLIFIYFRLFMLPQNKTNINCCTAAVAVYLPGADPGICVRSAAVLSPSLLSPPYLSLSLRSRVPLKPGRGSGERCKLSQRGPGRAQAENEFGAL